MLHDCVGDGTTSASRPLRIVGPDGAFTRTIAQLTTGGETSFTNRTGIAIAYDIIPAATFSASRRAMLLNALLPNATHGYDAIIASPSSFGDAAQVPGKLLDLSRIVSNDAVLAWEGIQPQLRSTAVTYDGAIVALPLQPVPFITYYHLDVFRRDGLQPPATWEQFADLAERYHGRDGLVGACTWLPDCRGESLVLRYILGSYVQTHGPTQGLLWDAATLESLADTPAVVAALRIMRRLRAVGLNSSNSGPPCIQREFSQGRCLLAITEAGEFKIANLNNLSMRGRLGMAPLPGSTKVLDRTTRQLVQCDPERCPLATDSVEEDGKMVPVNRSPIYLNTIIIFNGLSPSTYQFLAYTLFAYLISPNVIGIDGLLTENNDVVPVRIKDMSPENAPVWVQRGYDAGDVARFLGMYRSVMQSANPNVDTKTRFSANVTSAFLRAGLLAVNMSLPAETAVALAVRSLNTSLKAIVDAEGLENFGLQYRRSLNWFRPPDAAEARIEDTDTAEEARSMLPVIVAVPCAVALLAAVGLAVTVLLRRRRRANKHSTAAALAQPPDLTTLTTLVVTDIQDSTALWEALDAAVMDDALKLHHRVLRKALLEHGGYESATEGDSFILAFHSPRHAVLFCLSAQQALLVAPWPHELISRPPLPSAAEAWDDPAGVVVMSHRPFTKQSPRPLSGVLRHRGAIPSRRKLVHPVPANWTAVMMHSPSLSLSHSHAADPFLSTSEPAPPAPSSLAPARLPKRLLELTRSMNAPRNATHSPEERGGFTVDGYSIGRSPLSSTSRCLPASFSTPHTHGDDSTSGHRDGQGPAAQGAPRQRQLHVWASRPSSTSHTVCLDPASPAASTALGTAPASAAASAAARRSATAIPVASASAIDLDAGIGSCSSLTLAGNVALSASPMDHTEYATTPGGGDAAFCDESATSWPYPSPAVTVPARVPLEPLRRRSCPLRTQSASDLRDTDRSPVAAPSTQPTLASLDNELATTYGGVLLATANMMQGARSPREGSSAAGAWGGPEDAVAPAAPSDASRLPLRSQHSALLGIHVGTASDAAPRVCAYSAPRPRLLAAGWLTTAPPAPHSSEMVRLGGAALRRQVTEEQKTAVRRQQDTHSRPDMSHCSLLYALRQQWEVAPSPPPATASAAPPPPVADFSARGDAAEVAGTWLPGSAATDAEDGNVRQPGHNGGGQSGGSRRHRRRNVAATEQMHHVVYRGLRVRMGCVCTVYPGTDAHRNRVSGRMQYSGTALRMAKAVSDAAHGGMVVLGGCAYSALCGDAFAAAKALHHVQLLWLGRHLLSEDLPAVHLIQAVTHGSALVGRLALQRPPRTLQATLPPGPMGALAARVAGSGAVAMVVVVGAEALLAWDVSVATRALEILYDALVEGLTAITDDSPYIAEGAMGLVGMLGGGGPAPHGDGDKGAGAGGSNDSGHNRNVALSDISGTSFYKNLQAGRARNSSYGGSVAAGFNGELSSEIGPFEPLCDVLGGPSNWSSSLSQVPSAHLPSLISAGREPDLQGNTDSSSQRLHPQEPSRFLDEIMLHNPLGNAAISINSAMPVSPPFTRKNSPSLSGYAPTRSPSIAASHPPLAQWPPASGQVMRKRALRRLDEASSRGSGGSGGLTTGPGAMAVVFREAAEAARWLLRILEELPLMSWPPELLQNPLCEALVIDGSGAPSRWAPPSESPSQRLMPRPPSRRMSLYGFLGGLQHSPINTADASPSVGVTAVVAADAAASSGGGGGGGDREVSIPFFCDTVPEPSPAGGAGGVGADGVMLLLLRGLRVRSAVVHGELGGEMASSGTLSCQVSYGGRAWSLLSHVMSKSKAGQVATNAETAELLPQALARRLSIIKNV